MALTKCKECSREISDNAEVCPHCGARLKANKVTVKNPYKGKAKILIGKIAIIIGLIIAIAGALADAAAALYAGIVIIVASIIILALGLVQNWWFSK